MDRSSYCGGWLKLLNWDIILSTSTESCISDSKWLIQTLWFGTENVFQLCMVYIHQHFQYNIFLNSQPQKPGTDYYMKYISTIRNSYFCYPYNFFFFFNKFIYFYFGPCWVFVAARRAFSSCCERGLLFVAVHGLLIAVASFVAEHRL